MKDRLKALRKALGLKQREVAERLGVNVGAVGGWECGRDPIPRARIYQLCKEYNVRREWLEHGTGEMFDRPTEEEKYVKMFTWLFTGLTPEYQRAFLKAAVELLDAPKEIEKTQINNGTVEGDMIQN